MASGRPTIRSRSRSIYRSQTARNSPPTSWPPSKRSSVPRRRGPKPCASAISRPHRARHRTGGASYRMPVSQATWPRKDLTPASYSARGSARPATWWCRCRMAPGKSTACKSSPPPKTAMAATRISPHRAWPRKAITSSLGWCSAAAWCCCARALPPAHRCARPPDCRSSSPSMPATSPRWPWPSTRRTAKTSVS